MWGIHISSEVSFLWMAILEEGSFMVKGMVSRAHHVCFTNEMILAMGEVTHAGPLIPGM